MFSAALATLYVLSTMIYFMDFVRASMSPRGCALSYRGFPSAGVYSTEQQLQSSKTGLAVALTRSA